MAQIFVTTIACKWGSVSYRQCCAGGHAMLDAFAADGVASFLGRLEAAALRVAELEVNEGFPVHESFQLLWSDAVARRKQKHVLQESALLGLMQRHGMGCDAGTTVVELGAGTGSFTRHIALAFPATAPDAHFVVLDRQAFRSHRRVDGRMRKMGMHITRHTLDVRDFRADMLPVDSERTLFVSKHFCGPATDMALQLACNVAATGMRTAMCLATCCHGIMSAAVPFGGHVSLHLYLPSMLDVLTVLHYAALQEYLRDELGFRERDDWAMLCSCTGWATMNDTGALDVCPATGRTRAQKQQLGALCKRLIDQSRVRALRASGFADAKLVIYTDQSVENRAIVCANEEWRL